MQGNREAARKVERVGDFLVDPLKRTEFLKKICRRSFSPAQGGEKVESNPFQVSEWNEEGELSFFRFFFCQKGQGFGFASERSERGAFFCSRSPAAGSGVVGKLLRHLCVFNCRRPVTYLKPH